ncbi:MAG: helix-turn-helix transcriptional regulator [Candidatus Gastranaerophilales bacterium]|jgi:transcriptional regulator with XRE-family HTH domain|nr:helix-turn-helix transcriptional regulator [Candidatus Gastranaerophilales bacterium]
MESDIRKKLADKIIYLRNSKGISQETLAFEAKIDRSYMSRVERGIVSIGIVKLESIAKVLGVKVYELLEF